MSKFRKKPIVIEATEWFKHDFSKKEDDIVRYFCRPDIAGSVRCSQCGVILHAHGWIDTLEGGHRVCPGDWIITGVKGERYPCKPDIFEATYEKVEEVN